MRGGRGFLVALFVMAGAAEASRVEDATGLRYQEDAGVEGDAPSSCADLEPARVVTVATGAPTFGLLVPEEDPSDLVLLDVTGFVGVRLAVDLVPQEGNPFSIDFDVRFPDCETSIFGAAPSSSGGTSTSASASSLTKTVFAKNLVGYSCEAGRWHFVVNQLGDAVAPPAAIHVTWTDGAEEDVPLAKVTRATVAHYSSASNLHVTVAEARAEIDARWGGQFNLGSGPCDAVPFEPPLRDGNRIEFTPLAPEPHVIQVFVSSPAPPLGPSPASCHDICGAAFGPLMDTAGYAAEANPR
ncbi:MAG: hypothetical protein ACT4PT_05000 [Methanobacteriota archaeon]